MTVLKRKDHPRLDALLKRAVPKNRKHSVILFDHGAVTNHGSQWDGGSREFTLLCNIEGGNVRSMPGPTAPPQFGGGESTRRELDESTVAIKVGTFRGKPSTATVIATPEVANWLLGSDAVCTCYKGAGYPTMPKADKYDHEWYCDLNRVKQEARNV